MSPASSVASAEKLGRGVDVIRHRHYRKGDSERDQKMGESVLDQQQAEQLFIAPEAFRMDADGAIDQADQENEIDADPLRRRYWSARHSDSQAGHKRGCDKDQNPPEKSNVVSEFFAEHISGDGTSFNLRDTRGF